MTLTRTHVSLTACRFARAARQLRRCCHALASQSPLRLYSVKEHSTMSTPHGDRSPHDQPPVLMRPDLANSVWYGSALVSLLVSSETTGGHYALVHVRIQRAFAPPPHRHGPEAFSIIRG